MNPFNINKKLTLARKAHRSTNKSNIKVMLKKNNLTRNSNQSGANQSAISDGRPYSNMIKSQKRPMRDNAGYRASTDDGELLNAVLSNQQHKNVHHNKHIEYIDNETDEEMDLEEESIEEDSDYTSIETQEPTEYLTQRNSINSTSNQPNPRRDLERVGSNRQPRNKKRKLQTTASGTTIFNNYNNISKTIIEKITQNKEMITRGYTLELYRDLLQQEHQNELKTRLATIVITLNNQNSNYTIITELIHKYWNNEKQRPNTTNFRDKENVYVTFDNRNEKCSFITWITSSTQTEVEPLKKLIEQTGDKALDFNRKPVRIEIPNLNIKDINGEELEKGLRNTLKLNNGKVDNFKLSQPYNLGKQRSALFYTDQAGTNYLLVDSGGRYTHKENNKTNPIRLKIKIQCQPWICTGCLNYTTHRINECSVRRCNKCGYEGHQANNCTNMAFCRSCRKTGHRTKDKTCPIYISQTIKELRKMDIPIDLYSSHKLVLIDAIKNA